MAKKTKQADDKEKRKVFFYAAEALLNVYHNGEVIPEELAFVETLCREVAVSARNQLNGQPGKVTLREIGIYETLH